jgi:hypothetical protein
MNNNISQIWYFWKIYGNEGNEKIIRLESKVNKNNK